MSEAERAKPVKKISRFSASALRVSSSSASGVRLDRAVAAEVEAGDAAERRDVLVLLADRLLQHVDLDVAGLLGQFARMDDVARLGVQRAAAAPW